jgi:hypothetical protein
MFHVSKHNLTFIHVGVQMRASFDDLYMQKKRKKKENEEKSDHVHTSRRQIQLALLTNEREHDRRAEL